MTTGLKLIDASLCLNRVARNRGLVATQFGEYTAKIVGRVASLFYWSSWIVARIIFLCTIHFNILRREITARKGPYVLAVTHLSHLEPFIVALAAKRQIDFIARIEFYHYRILAFCLNALFAIKVNRQRPAPSTMRIALNRLKEGRVVGIFPEGGVCRGDLSVCRGGPIRLGVAAIAARAGVPIIPCVIVGAHELLKPGPWMPARRGHLWVAFGEPIPPPPLAATIVDRRAAYQETGKTLKAAFRSLYDELLQTYRLDDKAGVTYSEVAYQRPERISSGSSPRSDPDSSSGETLSEGSASGESVVARSHELAGQNDERR